MQLYRAKAVFPERVFCRHAVWSELLLLVEVIGTPLLTLSVDKRVAG